MELNLYTLQWIQLQSSTFWRKKAKSSTTEPVPWQIFSSGLLQEAAERSDGLTELHADTTPGTVLVPIPLDKQQSSSYCWQVLTAHVSLSAFKTTQISLGCFSYSPIQATYLFPEYVQGRWGNGCVLHYARIFDNTV